MKPNKYPKSAGDVLDDGRKYKPAVLRAMQTYRSLGPWRGDLVERVEKLQKLHRALCRAYSIAPSLIINVPTAPEADGNGKFNPKMNTITLTGKLSVLTYLHEFAHAAFGEDEFQACGWSINLFKRVFPIGWRKLKFDAHRCIVPETEATPEQ